MTVSENFERSLFGLEVELSHISTYLKELDGNQQSQLIDFAEKLLDLSEKILMQIKADVNASQ